MRRAVVSGVAVLSALACPAALVTGCRPAASSSSPVEPVCAQPVETELGLPTLDLPAAFTTTAGQLRFRVTGMHPDALIPIDTTTLFLGQAGTFPHRDPQRPERPDNASYRVRVSLDSEGHVDLPAGDYWAVSTAGGRIYAAACSGTTISDVTRVPS
jgi:hypothetical protein